MLSFEFRHFGAFATLASATLATPALAFDYLEHSFFADRGCREAQQQLAARFAATPPSAAELSRYLALAIACPNRWPDPATAPYCAKNGFKRLESNINHLPSEADGVAVTLGDFAALPDHISDWGPVRGLPKAEYPKGLARRVFEWIATNEPEAAGGLVGDVSEDACEGTDEVPWASIEKGLSAPVAADVATPLLSPLARAIPPRGPHDNAGAYSFDNPHFLDLIQRNVDHFGDRAYGAWLGHHSTAIDIAARSCESVIAFSSDELEDWAEGLGEFEKLDWDEMTDEELRRQGCRLLAARVASRIADWAKLGDPALVAPVRSRLASLTPAELDGAVSATLALVFEGSGLHYLQDTLSAGHMRAVHDRRGLAERRYDHDLDGRDGLAATLRTAEGDRAFVAFGDSYLLGPDATPGRAGCDWKAFRAKAPAPETLTSCHLENQRRIVAAAAASSLIDWASAPARAGAAIDCSAKAPATDRFVCANLPLSAPRVPGLNEAPAAPVGRVQLGVGTLPVPPPPFAYESLSFQMGLDAGGSGNQIGLRSALYTQLGPAANWLTSHNVGLRYVTDRSGSDSFTVEYGYGFHWRWAARFLVDAEPAAALLGFRDRGQGREFVAAISPRLGLTALPEGWVKIPIELSIAYRPAFMIYDGSDGFFGDTEGLGRQWIQFSVGLAFL